MSEQQQPASKVTYAKRQDGSYGLRITGFYPTEGQTVTVTKKNGDSEPKVIGKITWQGVDKFKPDEYIFLCTIDSTPVPGATRKPSTPPAAQPQAPAPPTPPRNPTTTEDLNIHYPDGPVGDDSALTNETGDLVSDEDLESTHASLSAKELADDDMPF